MPQQNTNYLKIVENIGSVIVFYKTQKNHILKCLSRKFYNLLYSFLVVFLIVFF